MDEKKHMLANDARMLNLASDVIYPKLDKLMNDRLSQIVGRFNGGEKEFLADVAYISALVSLKTDLLQTQTRGNKALESLTEG